MSFAAGLAAGIGAGIAIGMSSGGRQGQQQLCDYIEANNVVLFDEMGKKISVDELRENVKMEQSCHIGNKSALMLGILGLVVLMTIALVVFVFLK